MLCVEPFQILMHTPPLPLISSQNLAFLRFFDGLSALEGHFFEYRRVDELLVSAMLGDISSCRSQGISSVGYAGGIPGVPSGRLGCPLVIEHK